MQAEIIDPTARPIPADWEAFRLARSLPASMHADVLTALAWTSTRAVRVGIVREGGDVVAVLTGDVLTGRAARQYSAPARRRVAGVFSCRMPVSFSRGVHFADCLPRPERRQAIRAFESALRADLGPGLLGCLYEKVEDAEDLLFGPAVLRGTSPSTVLHNAWDDLDAYLAWLPARRRRRLVRLRREVAAAVRVQPFTAEEIDARQASRLDSLTRARHAGGRAVPPLSPVYLEQLARRPGVCFLGYADGERLLAFDLMIGWGKDLLTLVHGGLDSPQSGVRNLYFDLYLREIEHLIASGLDSIEFGPGMPEVKTAFGARLVPRQAVLRAILPGRRRGWAA